MILEKRRTINYKIQEDHQEDHHQTQEEHIFLRLRSLREAYYLLDRGNKDPYSDITSESGFTVQPNYLDLRQASPG